MYLLQQMLNGLALGGVLTLFALGFGLVFANMRVFNVAHAAVFAFAPIAAYFLMTSAGMPIWIVWPLSLVGAGILNVAIYLVAIRPLRERRDREMAAFVSTLGLLEALQELGDRVLDHEVVRFPSEVLPVHVWIVAGIRLTTVHALMLGITIVVFIVLWILVHRSGFGRQLRAVAYDRTAAEYLRVNSESVTVRVFFLSGALAGLAAVPVAVAFNQVSAELGSEYMVVAIAIMVLGGFGSIPGTVIAGTAVGILTSLTAAYATTSYRDVVIFGALLAFLAVRPRGLLTTAPEEERA